MTECLICGKEMKNLPQHVKMAHKMTMEEYQKTVNGSGEIEELPEGSTPEADSITPNELVNNRFDDKPELTEEDTIEKLCKEKDITLKELLSLIRRFKTGSSLDVTQTIKQKIDLGKRGAEALKNEKKVETDNLSIAESLVKDHNFEVITVRSGPPKVWVLEKG